MMATLVAALTLTLFLVPPASAARGYSTRYWDCCKVHCAWPANVRVWQSGASFASHIAFGGTPLVCEYRYGSGGSRAGACLRFVRNHA